MSCPICQRGPRVPPSPVGPQTKLIAWGEAAGADEVRNQEGFTGSSGRDLRKALRRAGLRVWSAWWTDARIPANLQEVAFTNAVLYRPEGNRFPGFEAARTCIETCQQELYYRDAHPWLALGANATEALTGFRLPALTVRGSLLPVLGRPDKWITSSIHPAFIGYGGGRSNPDEKHGKGQDQWIPVIAMDVMRALRCQRPNVPAVHLVSPSEMLDAFESWVNLGLPADVPFAIDVEGMAPHLSLLGVSWDPTTAWVMQWSDSCVDALNRLFERYSNVLIPTFHNASFDVPELRSMGVRVPDHWCDTINLAALLNPSVKLGLESQVLTYVLGSIVWKGLVDHTAGVDVETPGVLTYERLWTEVLTRTGLPVPRSRFEWYVRYNGNDVAYTLGLMLAAQRELKAQGRLDYYTNVMRPLQPILLDMGQRGMLADTDRMAYHRRACERLERMAQRILDRVSAGHAEEQQNALRAQVALMEQERDGEKARGLRAYSKAADLTKLRTKLRALEKDEGFNGDSNPQRRWLLYEFLGLPEAYDRDDGHVLTNEDTVTFKISQVQRGTVRLAKGAPPKAEVVQILRALIAIKRWATWRRNFLTVKDAHANL